jgi:hypothetical protein
MGEASCLGYGACEHHERSKTPGPRGHREGDRQSRVGIITEQDRTPKAKRRCRSGIPRAETWLSTRVPQSGHFGRQAAEAIARLPDRTAGTTYSQTVRSAPHPPDGRSRTKAPAACWGFRLVIIRTAHRMTSKTR